MKERTIYALGFFDGVHLGHQALLRECRRLATEYGCKAGAVTFCNHPDSLVLGKTPALINTAEDRQRLLGAWGIETILELPFDKDLMTTHWSSFLTQLVRHDAAGFVCGDDFRFGAGGSGTAQKLAAYCKSRVLPWAIVPGQTLDGTRVSSTHIRQLLEAGDLENANRFLGHPHILSGEVIRGRGLGHTLGIPTANLALPEQTVPLRRGVYACMAVVEGQTHLAVTNIGNRPTVGGHRVTVEPWLLDFEGDLYGKTVTLLFFAFLRPEQKFDSLEALKAEIQKNAQQTRDFFEKT